MIYVSDNTNVEAWVRKRAAGSRLARYVLRLVQRLETTHGFRVWAAGVGTHHNTSMDYITRAEEGAVRMEMERQGFREEDLLTPWHAIFGELEGGRPITLPSEPGELRSAVVRIGARSARSAPPIPRALRHVTAVELGPMVGSYAEAWGDIGARAQVVPSGALVNAAGGTRGV